MSARSSSVSPAVCLIDGLAYDNPPGSAETQADGGMCRNSSQAGIKVIASVNIQYVDGAAWDSGEYHREADQGNSARLVHQERGRNRDRRCPCRRTDRALGWNIADGRARGQQLARLRELALVLAADVVDHQLEHYLAQHGITQHLGTHERILVCITAALQYTTDDRRRPGSLPRDSTAN